MPQSVLKLLASAHHAHVHHSSYFQSSHHLTLTLLVEKFTTFKDQSQALEEYFKFKLGFSIFLSSQTIHSDLTTAIDEEINRQRPPGNRKDGINRPNGIGRSDPVGGDKQSSGEQ